MRRLIALFAFMVIALTSYAQSNAEHLTFKGIPITGSMSEFCYKLQTKGYTTLGQDNNRAVLIGDFAGRNATIGVAATNGGREVYAVVIFFDSSDEWNTLVSTYDYYKDLYTRKYGDPSVLKETNPAYSDSNTALMGELYQGRVVWASLWEVAGGEIELSIESTDGFYEGMVMICYRDSQNEEARIQRDLEDI